MTNFKMIELLFAELLSASQGVLSAPECEEVQEFIDVGEYGIALQTAAAIYVEEAKVPTADAVLLMERLAISMSRDPAPMLARLPKPLLNNLLRASPR